MRKYLISGSLIVDRVLSDDGITPPRVSPSGGAAYALTGIKLFYDRCALACYTGRDYDEYYRDWMDKNGYPWEGIKRITEHMTFLDLYYREDGVHEMAEAEDSLVCPDLPQFELVEPFLDGDVSDLAVHIIHCDVRDMLKKLQPYREKGLKVGYEIDHTDLKVDDIPAYIREVTDNYLDYYSMSLAELKEISPEIETEEEALEYIKSLKCPVFFRMGERGAYFVKDGKEYYSPMITDFGSIDPTGCGNVSTATVFMADTEGIEPLRALYMGAVAASVNASYTGLIPYIDDDLKARCKETVEKYLRSNQRR